MSVSVAAALGGVAVNSVSGQAVAHHKGHRPQSGAAYPNQQVRGHRYFQNGAPHSQNFDRHVQLMGSTSHRQSHSAALCSSTLTPRQKASPFPHFPPTSDAYLSPRPPFSPRPQPMQLPTTPSAIYGSPNPGDISSETPILMADCKHASSHFQRQNHQFHWHQHNLQQPCQQPQLMCRVSPNCNHLSRDQKNLAILQNHRRFQQQQLLLLRQQQRQIEQQIAFLSQSLAACDIVEGRKVYTAGGAIRSGTSHSPTPWTPHQQSSLPPVDFARSGSRSHSPESFFQSTLKDGALTVPPSTPSPRAAGTIEYDRLDRLVHPSPHSLHANSQNYGGTAVRNLCIASSTLSTEALEAQADVPCRNWSTPTKDPCLSTRSLPQYRGDKSERGREEEHHLRSDSPSPPILSSSRSFPSSRDANNRPKIATKVAGDRAEKKKERHDFGHDMVDRKSNAGRCKEMSANPVKVGLGRDQDSSKKMTKATIKPSSCTSRVEKILPTLISSNSARKKSSEKVSLKIHERGNHNTKITKSCSILKKKARLSKSFPTPANTPSTVTFSSQKSTDRFQCQMSHHCGATKSISSSSSPPLTKQCSTSAKKAPSGSPVAHLPSCQDSDAVLDNGMRSEISSFRCLPPSSPSVKITSPERAGMMKGKSLGVMMASGAEWKERDSIVGVCVQRSNTPTTSSGKVVGSAAGCFPSLPTEEGGDRASTKSTGLQNGATFRDAEKRCQTAKGVSEADIFRASHCEKKTTPVAELFLEQDDDFGVDSVSHLSCSDNEDLRCSAICADTSRVEDTLKSAVAEKAAYISNAKENALLAWQTGMTPESWGNPELLESVIIQGVLRLQTMQPGSATVEEREIQMILIHRDPDIVMMPQFLSSGECDHLLLLAAERYERSKTSRGYPSGKQSDYTSGDSETRTSEGARLELSETPIVEAVERRVVAATGCDPDKLESLVILRYSQGQYFKRHHDGVFRSHTVLVYLSDVDEGGETEFPYLGFKLVPSKGTAVMWANILSDGSIDARVTHEALPVTRGEKYAVNCFLNVSQYRFQESTAADKSQHTPGTFG